MRGLLGPRLPSDLLGIGMSCPELHACTCTHVRRRAHLMARRPRDLLSAPNPSGPYPCKSPAAVMARPAGPAGPAGHFGIEGERQGISLPCLAVGSYGQQHALSSPVGGRRGPYSQLKALLLCVRRSAHLTLTQRPAGHQHPRFQNSLDQAALLRGCS